MEDKERAEDNPTRKIHPRARANIFSKIFFCWTLSFFVKGFKKDITEDDLYGPLKDHESKLLGDKLEDAWRKEYNIRRTPSLWRVLIKVFGKEFGMYGLVLLFMEVVLKMVQPLLMGKLMEYYSPNQTTMTINDAYFYASMIAIVSLCNSLITHSYFLGLQHLGMRVRIACCSLVYRKALKLSKRAFAKTTAGQMVNILSNDVNRFDMSLIILHNVWVAPVETIIVIYLLYVNVGVTAMTGAIILIAFVPLQMFMGKCASVFRMRTALKTDQRVRLMNEIISGIEVIKMYTWEKPFGKLIEKARRLEINQVRAASYLRALNLSFMMFLSRVAILLCIVAYILTGHRLQAQYVYVVISFYSVLTQAVTLFLPQGITILAETNISVSRIQQFLMHFEVETEEEREAREMAKIARKEERKRKNKYKDNNSNDRNGYALDALKPWQNGGFDIEAIEEEKSRKGVYLNDVSTKWIDSNPDYTLKDITMSVAPGELVAIVGPVGSGKTTLLHTILKELNIMSGTIGVEGTISYASQEPWLFVSSIRQNILFGQEMDELKYKEVVRVCALERDFSLFPYGDRTLVGERGVMLSGGQKARINLARAIYKAADIYLLDDPLSAVDTHVGKQLFDDCISGFLKSKCVILVTHQLQYLRNVDRIYLLENGSIETSGSYADLQNSGSEFVKMFSNKTDDEENEVVKKEAVEEAKKRRSLTKLNPETGKVDKPEEIKEQRTVGQLNSSVYKRYFQAGGNWCVTAIIFCIFIAAQGGASFADYFLSYWINLEQDRRAAETSNDTTIQEDSFLETYLTSENCLYFYSALITFIVLITITRSLSFFTYAMRASRNLHNRMFSSIVYASMWFFNNNPSGRILNRFTKDMGAIDELLPALIGDTFQILLSVVTVTIVIASVQVWLLLPSAVLFCLFYLYRKVFLATSRSLKRVEGTTRSPVFSHLTASLQGLTTIRAFGAQDILRLEFDHHQDLHSSAFYMYLGCNRTFGFWLDINGIVYIGIVTLSFLFLNTETYGANVGLAITQSMHMTMMLQYGMRLWSDLTNQMTSVERVLEYTEISPEPEHGNKIPERNWPSKGAIEFQEVSMQYSDIEPFVLKKLSFNIEPKEKIGIVGRTGAGKSSLISALFRLTHIEGTILIDGVSTKGISLNSLRSKISIIPQEPFLFSGTLRKNLDPFEEYDDSNLWDALEEVELKTAVNELPTGLQSTVSEGGSNFSVGQRQLLCLARAVIRKNKILVMDEATANVDPQTDELIQKTIRRKFADCTVLTIAHRLHTVMDSDKVLVMDAGRAAEFDHPHLLLQRKGIFSGLVEQTGKNMAETLGEIARRNYEERLNTIT